MYQWLYNVWGGGGGLICMLKKIKVRAKLQFCMFNYVHFLGVHVAITMLQDNILWLLVITCPFDGSWEILNKQVRSNPAIHVSTVKIF